VSHHTHPQLGRLHHASDAHQALRKRLLEMSHLSAQQCHVPADRPDALLAILDRKQQLLREIWELDAPALFRDSAKLAACGHGDHAELARARQRLRAEANTNLELWQKLVDAEQEACGRCAARVEDLKAKLNSAERKDNLRDTYKTSPVPAAAPRFVDRLR